MSKEMNSSSVAFEVARQRAAGHLDLLELILWIELLTSLGVSPTAACTTWAGHKAREPQTKVALTPTFELA
jgi:hypothetical protein